MSELGVGNQQTKPEDLQQKDAAINGAIDGAVKHSMSSFTGAMTMMKGAERANDFFGAMSNVQGDTPKQESGSMFAGSAPRRKKGSQTLQQMLSTTDAMGHKLDRNQIKSKYAVVNAAWAGKRKGMKNGSDANSRDFVEELNLLKQRMAYLPSLLKQDKSLLRGYGMGNIYEAHTSVQAEKEKPHTDAIISGTLSDMDQFKDKFKSLDTGLQNQVMAQGSTQTKAKLKPLVSAAASQGPATPGQPS
ncbi:MAG: hypothetical protein K0R10_1629 [Alphaproteobacteria bacterium]|jgi:hypothetical protein|nr:hypothetical protein [Alphaproteobacteria bacterium]